MSTAQESIIHDLEKRQAELGTSIKDAVRDGASSTQFRAELKSVQQQLTTARSSVAAMQSRASQAAAQRVTQLGDVLADDAVGRITGAAERFGDVLANGAPAIDFSNAPAVRAALQNVAAARARISEAERVHADAAAEADKLATRKTEIGTRKNELQQQRISGEAGEGSHAELYALGEDHRTISEMHSAAKAKADGLLQPVQDARNALKGAEKQAAIVEHRLQAEHLAAHAKALDAALVACLRDAQAAGARAGVGIGALIQASLELRTWISTGAVTRPYGRG